MADDENYSPGGSGSETSDLGKGSEQKGGERLFDDSALRRRLARAFYESGRIQKRFCGQGETGENSPVQGNTLEVGRTHSTRIHWRQASATGSEPPSLESMPKGRGADNQADAMYPMISYNAPALKRFSGKAGDHQSVTDFIEAIERQAKFECRNDEATKVKLQLSLFRTNLKGDARAHLNMLTTQEKEDWSKIREIYIGKFKTERDVRAKQRAKEQCASFKQTSDESLKAYGERAMKLRQLIDSSSEGFLVYRFLKGVKDKGVRRILAAGQDDLGKVTVAQLNQKINNLLQAGE